MTSSANNETMALTGDLLLSELSDNKFPDIKVYQNIKLIDLQHLKNIDSAGVAYLVQIKTNNSDISFVGVSDKILILADLYGVNFLFK